MIYANIFDICFIYREDIMLKFVAGPASTTTILAGKSSL